MYDEVCLMHVQKEQVIGACITAGYLSYDFLIEKIWIADPSPQAAQFLWHHIIGSTGLVVGMLAGFAAPGVGCCSLMVEISTVFINYRGMYNKEELTQTIPSII